MLRLLSAAPAAADFDFDFGRDFAHYLGQLFGAVTDAGAGVVNALLGILRLAGE